VLRVTNTVSRPAPGDHGGTGPLFWEAPPDEWDRFFFRTNLQGVMNCCHAALPGMVAQRKGRTVTIVSDAGRMGGARLAAYSAAKAGAAGFVRALAREAGRFGITCNAISLSTLNRRWARPRRQLEPGSTRPRSQYFEMTTTPSVPAAVR
jgi:NAD(P)-dependent dehydrogenase (short-subunit alcohol dehydrogenase family)